MTPNRPQHPLGLDLGNRRDGRRHLLFALPLLVLPVLHPIFIPWLGPPSHLAWFLHVVGTALVTYRWGRYGAAWYIPSSVILVFVGERLFGAGYGIPADLPTALSLSVSVGLMDVLMYVFASAARRLTLRYQILFEALEVGVILTDARHRIVAANPEACSILACRTGSIVGLPVDRLLPEPIPRIEDLETGGRWEGSVPLEKGPQAPKAHLLVAAHAHHRPHFVQVLLLDRTIEVAQEAELARQGKLASLGEALAGVAHEFKNPLQGIMGYADLGMLEGRTPEQMKGYFQKVKDQTLRLNGMVKDLLGFSRPDTGSDGRVHLPAVIREVTGMQRIALGKGIRIEEKLLGDGIVAGRADRIEQILLNLMSNAADAIEESGGSWIGIETERTEEEIRISVEDDGSGISEEMLPRLFEPFATSKPKGKGTGLGLALSRRLARSMGGDLLAENRPEGGARFTLVLPHWDPHQDQAHEDVPHSLQVEEVRGDPLT